MSFKINIGKLSSPFRTFIVQLILKQICVVSIFVEETEVLKAECLNPISIFHDSFHF